MRRWRRPEEREIREQSSLKDSSGERLILEELAGHEVALHAVAVLIRLRRTTMHKDNKCHEAKSCCCLGQSSALEHAELTFEAVRMCLGC